METKQLRNSDEKVNDGSEGNKDANMSSDR